MHHELSRRDLLRLAGLGLSGLGLAAIGGCGSDDGNGSPTSTPGIVVDPPPETTTIRLPKMPALQNVHGTPLYLAEQFLQAEGFTDVQYVDVPLASGGVEQLAAGEIDIGLNFAWSFAAAADAGDQLVILAGVRRSAFTLFGNDRVQSLRDFKGKRIWILPRDATHAPDAFWAALLGFVGIDIENEVEFVELSLADVFPAIQDGTIDVWVFTPPNSTLLRNLGDGHVVLDGMMDPPWSQYFGNFATGNRDFIEKHPAATKRALRAILKAADVCASEPDRAARYLVDRGLTLLTHEQALDGIAPPSYAAWREFDPEDTVRFYALRLREAGLVKSTPDELIARATDWRYLNEIKRELAVA
jgi:NitT/TauT family transport system substrate-binding protein